MKEKAWVVVANCERAKFYKVVKVGQLEEIQSFIHPENHKKASDLEADKEGRNNERYGNGSNTYQPKTTVKEKKDTFFAKMLIKELEDRLSKKQFQSLYIVAEPRFLGTLKKELTPKLEAVVDKLFNKDLVDENPTLIWDLVPLTC